MKLYAVTSTLGVDGRPNDHRPAESQGIFPPGTKRHICEQSGGRIMTFSYHWDETHNGINTRTCDIVLYKAEERLNSPSNDYYGYTEFWHGTKLLALATGEGYCSPNEHLEKQRENFQYVARSGADVWFDVLPEGSDQEEIVNFLLQKMQFPFSYTKSYLAEKYPHLIPRDVEIIYFGERYYQYYKYEKGTLHKEVEMIYKIKNSHLITKTLL